MIFFSQEGIASVKYGERKSKDCDHRLDGSPLFPNRSRGYKYYVEVKGEHKYPEYADTMKVDPQMYNLQLKWNGRAEQCKFNPRFSKVMSVSYINT